MLPLVSSFENFVVMIFTVFTYLIFINFLSIFFHFLSIIFLMSFIVTMYMGGFKFLNFRLLLLMIFYSPFRFLLSLYSHYNCILYPNKTSLIRYVRKSFKFSLSFFEKVKINKLLITLLFIFRNYCNNLNQEYLRILELLTDDEYLYILNS